MRKILAAPALPLLALLLAPPPATAGTGAAGMSEGVARALGPVLSPGGHVITPKTFNLERIALTGDVAHYSFDLRVGAGEHDVVRLHRIVRERSPWVPARAKDGLFLVHGDAWGFEATFLTSLSTPEVPDPQNVAVFLAERGLDVWGLDFRWALVPPDTTDRSFMADWDLGTSVGDLDTALAAARLVRLATGSGLSKLQLLGFSRGGQVGWAQLAAETARPAGLRHVRGFVAVDHTFKTDDEALRLESCASYDSIAAAIAGGAVATDFRVVADIGDLAATAPDDPSPFFPILTNADFAEWAGASAAGGAIPHLHSVGGVVDPDTFETELLYAEPAHWFAFLSGVSAFQPLGINLDGAALVCDELDSPYDDGLADVTVPVLYVGMAGAYGAAGVYTTTLIASPDVTTLFVSESANPEEDWGHNDPFLAEDAAAVVWQPILDWIEAR